MMGFLLNIINRKGDKKHNEILRFTLSFKLF